MNELANPSEPPPAGFYVSRYLTSMHGAAAGGGPSHSSSRNIKAIFYVFGNAPSWSCSPLVVEQAREGSIEDHSIDYWEAFEATHSSTLARRRWEYSTWITRRHAAKLFLLTFHPSIPPTPRKAECKHRTQDLIWFVQVRELKDRRGWKEKLLSLLKKVIFSNLSALPLRKLRWEALCLSICIEEEEEEDEASKNFSVCHILGCVTKVNVYVTKDFGRITLCSRLCFDKISN